MTLSLNPEQFLALFYMLQKREPVLGDDNLLKDIEDQMRGILLDLLVSVNDSSNLELYKKWKEVESKKIQSLDKELDLLKFEDSLKSTESNTVGILSKKNNKF